LGFIALESGWTVTEVGRQPWIIQGVMRTSEAVTKMPGIQYTFYLFTLYLFHPECGRYFLIKKANPNGA
jgi:cytochrome d ubiquinol oxidase subunit I